MGERQYEVERIPFHLVWQEESPFKETYGGAADVVVVEGQHHRPKGSGAKTALVFMHPTGIMNLLPMPNALAAAGIPCLTCGSRYPHNDSGLIMEKVLLDLGQYVRYAKETLGYERVVLAGWSGGGSLSMFYQSQAEKPSIEATPAGDPVDVKGAKLVAADAVLQLAAHVSRAITLTEWLDASIRNELDPEDRDPDLDLYDPRNSNQPPYSKTFLERYAAAQIARSEKIDAWVLETLDSLRRSGRSREERAFVVHGTMAAPCWLDPAVEPNDRKPGVCYMGDPRLVNMMPAGLARYSSLRAWLSQWSFRRSRADGPACAADVSVPVLVVENSADNACVPSHARRIFAGVKHAEKELHRIQGATHYYLGQSDKLAEAVGVTKTWLEKKGFVVS